MTRDDAIKAANELIERINPKGGLTNPGLSKEDVRRAQVPMLKPDEMYNFAYIRAERIASLHGKHGYDAVAELPWVSNRKPQNSILWQPSRPGSGTSILGD